MFPSDKEGFAPEFDARVLKSRLRDYVFDPVTDYLLLHQDVDVETVELRLGEVATSILAGLDYEHVPNQLATEHQRIYFDQDIEIDGSRLIQRYSRARHAYIQDMLAQNRNRITDVLTDIHADIKSHISQLVSSIDQAFKYSVVNETWNVSVHEPGRRSLLLESCRKGFFQGHFGDGDDLNWLGDAKMEITERLDLQEIGLSISESSDRIHPLLPFCLYVSELDDFRNEAQKPVKGLSFEVLLAGYFLMTNATRSKSGERSFFNSGVLFLVDLIDNLPRPEHIKLAFSHRLQKTENALSGDHAVQNESDLHNKALEAWARLSTDNKTLFSILAENIQLSNYSPRISKTRKVLEKVLDTCQADDTDIPLLQINFELMSKAADDSDEIDYKQEKYA